MGRPTIFDKPLTDAERKARWKARKQNVLNADVSDSDTLSSELARRSRAISFAKQKPQSPQITQTPQPLDEIDELVAKGVREAQAINQLLPAPLPPSISEEQYVQSSLAAASLPLNERERRHRAEQHARWRYRGYLAGIVASL